MSHTQSGYIRAGGARLEFTWTGPGPDSAPTLVFLHEGLGCVSTWRDFPERVASRTGFGALVYSRQGYGKSDPVTLPRATDFMNYEACTVLPELLREAGVRRYVLVGHSDGASIALIFAAAGVPAIEGLQGLCLEAPHAFVEDVTVQSIAAIGDAFRNGGLRKRLRRHHGSNVDGAFLGWNQVWLDPLFRDWNIVDLLKDITVPIHIVQGRDDEYGTLAQVAAIKRGVAGPCDSTVLDGCGHSPHRDQAETVLEVIAQFVETYSDGLVGESL